MTYAVGLLMHFQRMLLLWFPIQYGMRVGPALFPALTLPETLASIILGLSVTIKDQLSLVTKCLWLKG